MRGLIFGWFAFVYIFFSWNVVPHFYRQYQPLINQKIISKSHASNTSSQTFMPGQKAPSDRPKTINNQTQPAVSHIETLQETPQNKKSKLVQAAQNISKLFIVLWVFWIAYLLGNKLIGLCGSFSVPCPPVLSIGLGLGIVSYSIFLLGSCFELSQSNLFILLAILTGLAFTHRPKSSPFNLDQKKSAFLWLVAGLWTLLLFKTFIPDQFYDSLSYHLALPQNYLNYKKIIGLPYNMNASLPQTMEMLYTLGLGLGGNDVIPLMLQLGTGSLLLALLVFSSKEHPYLTALIWFSSPLVMENMRFSKPDIFLSFLVTGSFLLMIEWEKTMNDKLILLSGIFMGLGMGTKYNGIPFTFFLFLLLVIKSWRLNTNDKFRIYSFFLLPAFLIFSPWLIKNFMMMNNPLYPFFQNIFGFHMMRKSNWITFINENNQFFHAFWTPSLLLKIFWNHTFYGHHYPSMNFIGPIWLASLPLLFVQKYSTELYTNFIFIFLIYIFGTTQTTLGRYFFLPILPLFALSISRMVSEINDLNFKKMIKFFLLTGVILQLPGWLPILEQVSYARGGIFGISESKESKIYSAGYYSAFHWVNSQLSDDSKILFVGETKSHRFLKKVIAPSVHNENPLSVFAQNSSNSFELYTRISEMGVTHILFNWSELERLRNYPMFYWRDRHKEMLSDLFIKHMKEIYRNESISIFQLLLKPTEIQKKPAEFDQLFNH